ncbi:CynX/NimT family MFS transporter [Neobacillus sp. LXY-1]|uniref:CynX/NimT family MFS transporter n=1 Tax=Neobacillus sp. LXY-1 TaxID=3379133 RepID=UPI003EE3B5C3
MESQKSRAEVKSAYLYLLITGIVLVAFNLRPAITSIGPLIGDIQEDVGLAHWSAGLLMSMPLIVFAFMSPLVPKIAIRLSNEVTLLFGLFLLMIGIVIRSVPVTISLFIGTLAIGIGIAIGNVLLPAIVKDKFPKKFGLMTSVYSTSMALVASLASGLSVPLAHEVNLGWQGALIVWGIPAIAAFVIWIYLLKANRGVQSEVKKVKIGSHNIWCSFLAWQIAIFMGFQSFLFYVTVSWLPEILHSHGMSTGTAGWMLSFSQLVGLPASFLIPVFAGRFKSQFWLAFILSLLTFLGFVGLLWGGPSYFILIVSIILIGIGLGGNFPLALTYIGLRARNAAQAAELSGMAQSSGYIIAAAGPLFIGYLFDQTHQWTVPLITLIIVSLIVMVFGMLSGRNRYV